MAINNTETEQIIIKMVVRDEGAGLPMTGMTVHAVKVLLATAITDNSSSSLDTSPTSFSFSA